jgi:excisionase family DNA binding protein
VSAVRRQLKLAGHGQAAGPRPERLAYTPGELAAMVGLSAKAVYRAIHRGELRAARVANGTRLLIPVSAALAWIEASANDSATSYRPDATVRHNGSRGPLSAALRSAESRGR